MPDLCYSWIYKLVLNISCQHLGDECNLEGFLVPFGHRVGGMYIFGIYVSWLNICLYWLYHANTWEMNVIWGFHCAILAQGCGNVHFWNMCQLAKYMFVLDISCQHLGDECNLEGFLVPFWHRVGGMTNFWNMCKLAIYICLYWIYIANYLGMKVSCTCSNCS